MSEHHNDGRTPDYMQERVTLRYRETEQIIEVPLSQYLKERKTRYQNWQLAADASCVSVPLLLSMFVADTDQRYGRQI